jgi:hypothetical protein
MAPTLYIKANAGQVEALLVAAGSGERAMRLGGESGMEAFWATGHG